MINLSKKLILVIFITYTLECSPDEGAFVNESNPNNNFQINMTGTACDFYDQVLEKRFPCNQNGYALSYGGKYCRAFDASKAEFSEKGNKWRKATMRCLINSLRNYLFQNDSNEDLSCDKIKEHGFNSHPVCYTSSNPSFCELNIRDYKAILKIIKRKDLLSRLGRQQIARVAKICLNKIRDTTKSFYVVPGDDNELAGRIRLLEEIASPKLD